MNEQINLRLPGKLLDLAKERASQYGFSSVQEFIKEALREKLLDKPDITKKELALVVKLAEACQKQKLFMSEEEFYTRLKKKRKSLKLSPTKR